jgi:RNA polymerase sigma-70 factor, ECF subfamily
MRSIPLNNPAMEVVSKYHATREDMLQEQVLVEAAKQNPEKFRPLYDAYYERIFRYVYQRVDDKEVAFDVTAQVFLKAITNLHRYQFKGVPFASWLYRIAQSEVYQLFREQKAQRTINVDTASLRDMADEMEDDQYGPYIDILKTAVADLEEEDMKLIEMRYFEKRPFKEIAEILDMTENNAKVKVYRILERLKKKLIDLQRRRA